MYVCNTHLEHVDVTLALEEDSGEDEGGGIHNHKQAQGFDKLKISGQQTGNCLCLFAWSGKTLVSFKRYNFKILKNVECKCRMLMHLRLVLFSQNLTDSCINSPPACLLSRPGSIQMLMTMLKQFKIFYFLKFEKFLKFIYFFSVRNSFYNKNVFISCQ